MLLPVVCELIEIVFTHFVKWSVISHFVRYRVEKSLYLSRWYQEAITEWSGALSISLPSIYLTVVADEMEIQLW